MEEESVSNEPVVSKVEVDEVAKSVVEEAAEGEKKRNVRYLASIYPGFKTDKSLPKDFGEAVIKLEATLGYPVWVIIQNERPGQPWSDIDEPLYNRFFNVRSHIARGKPVGLLIDSPGGDARAAYKIARLFQRRATEFSVLIPKYAKSAATLIALAANKIIMGEDAELGPLDVQMFDFEREEYGSALNAVQSLERINAFSLTTIDQLTPLLMRRTNRKLDVLMPLVMNYVVSFVRPLLEKIDTVDYTKKSRELKVAEEYAFRLMKCNYREEDARRIAQHLVDRYPTHGFVIDREEAEKVVEDGSGYYGLGANVEGASEEVAACLDNIVKFVDRLTVIGRIVEVEDEPR